MEINMKMNIEMASLGYAELREKFKNIGLKTWIIYSGWGR